VKEWQEGELCGSVFAARHELSAKSLYHWSSVLKRKTSQDDGEESFAEVHVVKPQPPRCGDEEPRRVELVTLSGRVIRLLGPVDAETLAVVLQVAERC